MNFSWNSIHQVCRFFSELTSELAWHALYVQGFALQQVSVVDRIPIDVKN